MEPFKFSCLSTHPAHSHIKSKILGCAATKEALIIDPVICTVDRDTKILQELELNPVYCLNTHIHADHVTGSGRLKTSQHFPRMKSVISSKADAKADLFVKHNDVIRWGHGLELDVRETPGHTNSCLTFVSHQHKMAFTGDALLIRGCGRTDFQQGDSRRLYLSVHNQILSLSSDFLLFPAHDYLGRMVTTVGEEKRHNPRFSLSEDDFIKFMKTLQLPYPKKIDIAIPANLLCGIPELMDEKLRERILSEENEMILL